MIYKDIDILNKLYAAREILTDPEEKKIINQMIQKRKVNFEIKDQEEYSKKELGRNTKLINKASIEAMAFCSETYDFDPYSTDLMGKNYELFEKEYTKKREELTLINAKLNRNKNKGLLFIQTKETFKIFVEQEFIQLILKYKNYETSKH